MDASTSFLVEHTILTVVVFFVGRALRRGISAGSEARRTHGRYVFWWTVGAFAVGGPLALLTGAELPFGAAGMAYFCMLGGWLVGMVHGAVVLVLRREKPSESPPAARSSDA